MPVHSYCRCWVHMIWGTRNREPLISSLTARAEISKYLTTYAIEKGIYLKINHVYFDHVHTLIDLPPNLSIEEAIKLFKGASSHWINQSQVIPGQFNWQRGYGAFSVSQSRVDTVCKYIGNQVEHHRKKTFEEEIQEFVRSYGLIWREESGGYEKVGEVRTSES